MVKNRISVIDIGSSKINFNSIKLNNNNYEIDCITEAKYSGFKNGKFVSVNDLKETIINCYNLLLQNNKQVGRVFVSVPAEFSFCTIKNVEQEFDKLTKIKESHLISLHKLIALDEKFLNLTLIDYSSIYFELDNDLIVENPLNKKTIKFNSCISYIFASNKFIKTITEILNELNIYNITFVSSVMAQNLFLLDEKARENSSTVIDCGAKTTSVSLINKNNLLTLNAFSLGGDYILSDLKSCLNLDDEEAEFILNQVDLTNKDYLNKFYVVNDKSFSCKITNNIVLSRIEQIINSIKQCFLLYDPSYFDGVKIYLTGGGLTYIKGAVEYLAELLQKPVYIVKSEIDELKKPEQSSLYGLVEFAVHYDISKEIIIDKIYE